MKKIILILVIFSIPWYSCTLQNEPDIPKISDFDEVACKLVQDTSLINLPTSTFAEFDSTWATSKEVVQNAGLVLDSLSKSNVFIYAREDSAYNFQLPDDLDTSYVLLKNDTEHIGKVIFYLREQLVLILYNNSGIPIAAVKDNMPLATVAACMIDTVSPPEPIFKIRQEYYLEGNEALIQIIVVEQSKRREIPVVISQG